MGEKKMNDNEQINEAQAEYNSDPKLREILKKAIESARVIRTREFRKE
jgi:hypothetical protein